LLLYGLIHIQHTYCVYQNMKLYVYIYIYINLQLLNLDLPNPSSLSLSLLLLKLLKVGGETEDESRRCRVCGDGRHVSPCLWKILPCFFVVIWTDSYTTHVLRISEYEIIYIYINLQLLNLDLPNPSSLSLSLLLLKLLKVGGETEDESRSCRVCGDGRHVSPCLWKKILTCQILSVEDFTLFAERF
jgi:hypothetical protein